MLQGHLLQKRIKVQRNKFVMRRSDVIRRRVYSNPHPNAVWHVDGNHKMIRWRLVIHAGIDGFSRCVVYLKCSFNNCATSVLDVFLKGISEFGIPFSVRSDHGGENIEIWKFMLCIHKNSSCVITGASVHNERVERLWGGVTRCISQNFIKIFQKLEEENILDPLNEVDIFCLHYIFLPRIIKSLDEFRGSWNHHSLSTEGNKSPQLFTEGVYLLAEEGGAINPEHHTDMELDEILSIPSDDEVPVVTVPSTKFQPCPQILSDLKYSDDMGKDLFLQCLQILGLHLQIGCSNGQKLD